ncbi:unknown [[Mannheimia] succiniciproducens MBEL55E]|uniref:Uncharacterized protein n=1 Tax=Mannheimia succiniciproducens (strain KCTC 0769BP / MBEL55E) TaxID=221988 RepID=Q65SR1_MANSM|nr:unknown [[Mannheimia] succiniciproducens MBEL55E]
MRSKNEVFLQAVGFGRNFANGTLLYTPNNILEKM